MFKARLSMLSMQNNKEVDCTATSSTASEDLCVSIGCRGSHLTIKIFCVVHRGARGSFDSTLCSYIVPVYLYLLEG